ncbi:MAG: arsenate reductase (azurin) small subunit [Thiotrichales bacterium]|nr:arsenate reductase (azurin) small subunit [Thiotrichales bacterium]MBT3613645.1 arsenate reductase (azurin) small subunit [Thiotrichales bacterium]MBT3753160.1 arsenate reductase (azurin) small subunit [Thiotrichales bacterium]MBT3837494.1 arsenate reductase (azurin) small subunit [Thiotrichales bacterium]MBT4574550.1 arsenate reductase (azurin) small subunit [Thiotrichales bacterium]
MINDTTVKKSREDQTAGEHGKCMLNRRQFLMYSGATAATASTVSLSLFPGTAKAAQAKARVVGYPRKLVGKLSELKDNVPLLINYPDNGKNSFATMVKTGVKCGGGVGTGRDLVAFSALCTHQGGPLVGKYKVVDEHRIMGSCPLHLSTYDVTRHGIIISGQAYESLPQVLLELDGDEIYAVGMMGLIYGRNQNLMPETTES